MEYGLFVSHIRELPADPRSACAAHWLPLLPPAPLRAIYFGSEFCPELLPGGAQAEGICRWARQAGLEPVLLTPLLTSPGLERLARLLQWLASRGFAPDVVCNDFGALNLMRSSFPQWRRRAGRLMNRGLRDPRLLGRQAPSPPAAGAAAGKLRSLLLKLGVQGVETDPDLEGIYLGPEADGVQRVLHFPYVAAATGRNCLIKAEGAPSAEECFTKGLGLPCPGLCRGRFHPVERDDCTVSLWRAGNTIFYQVPQSQAGKQLPLADRVVLYERPTA